ncbi:MAG: hypothetical protein HP496_12530 [Nitrospira sp.]|nr:hypothetical protein [Nitrospira sp.]
MSKSNDIAIALNLRLKLSDSSAHPRAAIAKTTKDGQAAPKGLDGPVSAWRWT